MSIGTSPFEANPFCRTPTELDLNDTLIALERSLSNGDLIPSTRSALENAVEVIREGFRRD